MAFFAQKLIYTINIWFNFVHGTFFEQDYLLNLIIFGTQMCTYEPDAAQNQTDYFFKLWLSKDPSIGRILSGGGYGSMGLLSGKTEALRAKAASSSYSAAVDFLHVYSVLVAKNH